MEKPYEFTLKTAAKLKYLRKLHGFSQQEIAKKLYMGQTTYSQYERGLLVMNGTLAREIANIYNVSVSYLLDDDQQDILITKEQLEKLIELKNVISEIETASIKSERNLPEDQEYKIPKTKWKINTNKNNKYKLLSAINRE